MLETATTWWNALQQQEQVGVIALAGGTTLISYFVTRGILGKIMARKRERQHQQFQQALRKLIETGEFGQAIEDKLVCEIQKKIADGRISHDEARMIYAHYSRLGLWGLSPRKLNIRPTGLDMTELKERLMQKRAEQGVERWVRRWKAYTGTIRTVHTEQGSVTVLSVDKLLEGVKL